MTHADLVEFDRLWAAGLTVQTLADRFGITPRWACRLRKRRGLPTRMDVRLRWPDGAGKRPHRSTAELLARLDANLCEVQR